MPMQIEASLEAERSSTPKLAVLLSMPRPTLAAYKNRKRTCVGAAQTHLIHGLADLQGPRSPGEENPLNVVRFAVHGGKPQIAVDELGGVPTFLDPTLAARTSRRLAELLGIDGAWVTPAWHAGVAALVLRREVGADVFGTLGDEEARRRGRELGSRIYLVEATAGDPAAIRAFADELPARIFQDVTNRMAGVRTRFTEGTS